MKSLLELAEKRQSDRAYLDCPVEPEKLHRILEAARFAPSACNAQPWKIIVVDNQELKNRIADATSNRVLGFNHFTKQAPVHLVVVEEPANFTSRFGGWSKKKHYPHIDIGILAGHIALAAADEDLGTCIVGWFDEDKIHALLKIPKNRRVVLVILLGYPAGVHRTKKRKLLPEIVSHNDYATEWK
jgi:nitroreductase